MPYKFQLTHAAENLCDVQTHRNMSHVKDTARAIGQWCCDYNQNTLNYQQLYRAAQASARDPRTVRKHLGALTQWGVILEMEAGFELYEIDKARRGQQVFGRPRVYPLGSMASRSKAPEKVVSLREAYMTYGPKNPVKSAPEDVSMLVNVKSNSEPEKNRQEKTKEKNKDPTNTPYANEKATAVPTASVQDIAVQQTDIADRSVAAAFASLQAAAANLPPEEARQAPFRPRRVAAAPRTTPPQAKTPQRQIEAPGPPPPTPPPNEHEILEALLDMDVDEKDWGTRDRVRGMIVKGKIERLCLENAAYEYRMRRKDPTRDPIRCPEKWLVQRLPAGQAKLEAARHEVGMVATFGQTKAGVRQCPHGQESPQEKAPHPVAGTG